MSIGEPLHSVVSYVLTHAQTAVSYVLESDTASGSVSRLGLRVTPRALARDAVFRFNRVRPG